MEPGAYGVDSGMLSSEKLDSFLFKIMRDGITPSLSVAIVSHDKTLYRSVQGYSAVLPYEEEADLNTLYDLSTLTMVVQTTMLSCRLIEKNLLSLDTTVGDVLDNPGNYKDVSVREILTHTGGFNPETRLSNYVDTPERAIAFILNQAEHYRHGCNEAYSNFGFIILGKMLEKITRMPLDVAAEEYVYRPLGMSHTLNNPYEKGIRNIASTDTDDLTGKVIKGIVHDENARFLGGVAGNAGVFSNLADMEAFMKMILSRGMLPDGTRFLSSDLVDMFYTDFTPGMPESRGLGFLIGKRGKAPIHHDRGFAGFGHTGFTGTSVWFVPEKDRAVCMLSNRIHPSKWEVQLIGRLKDLHDMVFEC